MHAPPQHMLGLMQHEVVQHKGWVLDPLARSSVMGGRTLERHLDFFWMTVSIVPASDVCSIFLCTHPTKAKCMWMSPTLVQHSLCACLAP